MFAQLAAPLHFVDFLREPVVDEETGETLDAHPSYYEAASGGLAEIRCYEAHDIWLAMEAHLVLFSDVAALNRVRV